MGTAIKNPVPGRVKPSFIIFDIRHSALEVFYENALYKFTFDIGIDTLTLRAERQSARMSKITNDGLTRSGTGCFTCLCRVSHMATVGVKGLSGHL